MSPVDRLRRLATMLRDDADRRGDRDPDDATKSLALADVFEAAADDIAGAKAGVLALSVLTFADLGADLLDEDGSDG